MSRCQRHHWFRHRRQRATRGADVVLLPLGRDSGSGTPSPLDLPLGVRIFIPVLFDLIPRYSALFRYPTTETHPVRDSPDEGRSVTVILTSLEALGWRYLEPESERQPEGPAAGREGGGMEGWDYMLDMTTQGGGVCRIFPIWQQRD